MATSAQIDAAVRRESKPVTMKVFKNFLDTVTDASKGQWATFTVDVITHARRTRLPRRDLLEVLAMLGITDGTPARRDSVGKAVPPRATCSVCHTQQDLQKDGRVRSHKRGGKHCPGRHQMPAAEPAAVAS